MSLEAKTTLVSAFVSNVNMCNDRTMDKYFELGQLLINSDVPKILFFDETMYDYVINKLGKEIISNKNTRIYKINKKDSYLYRFDKYITDFQIITDNTNKDTIEYMFTMCNKTEWIKNAILLNDFNTSNYIWVDFGIRHVFQCSDKEFIEKIDNLKYKEYNNVRIASVWHNLQLYSYYEEDICNKIMWFFAGGVFGGNKYALQEFSDRMKEKCIEIIITKKTIMWEVNIWYLIYKECNHLFDRYFGDHNDLIISNY
jgi:hypothetical protein